MLGIVFCRLQELMFSTLDSALMLTDSGREAFRGFAWQTALMLALVNIIQIVLIFAVAYLVLTGPNPGAFSHLSAGRSSEFFLSWISLPPLGGGATPLSTTARALTISEEATGLLMIVIAVGRFLAGQPNAPARPAALALARLMPGEDLVAAPGPREDEEHDLTVWNRSPPRPAS
jgi:hypothetical protein